MEIELSEQYGLLLDRHIQDTRLHLAGVSPLENENVNDEQEIPLPLHLPQWSEEEDNIFFHALSIHSRLRPDLIAEHLPDKSPADVALYIDFFDQQEALDVIHPFALESSPQFIENEEGQAKLYQAALDDAPHQCFHREIPEEFAAILERIDKVAAAAIDQILDTDSSGLDHIMGEHDTDDTEATHNAPSRDSYQGTNLDPCNWHDQPEDSLLAPSQRSPLYSTVNTPDEGASSSPTSKAEGKDLSALHIMTPADRRRYYKKMYMRRKRGVEDDRVENLTSGRKRRAPVSHANSGTNSEVENGNTIAAGEHVGRQQTPQDLHMRVTSAETMAQQLREMGITPRLLEEMDMDLFHLIPLLALNRKKRPVSAAVIRLLNGLVVEYVYDLVRQTIISRELEVDIKRSEEWGIYRRGELTKDSVLSAVSIVHKRRLQGQGVSGPAKRNDYFYPMLPGAYIPDDNLMDEDLDSETLEAEFQAEERRGIEDQAQDMSWDVWILGQ